VGGAEKTTNYWMASWELGGAGKHGISKTAEVFSQLISHVISNDLFFGCVDKNKDYVYKQMNVCTNNKPDHILTTYSSYWTDKCSNQQSKLVCTKRCRTKGHLLLGGCCL